MPMKPHVRLPPDRRFDLLAVLGDERPMQTLLDHLRKAGFMVDTARDLEPELEKAKRGSS